MLLNQTQATHLTQSKAKVVAPGCCEKKKKKKNTMSSKGMKDKPHNHSNFVSELDFFFFFFGKWEE